MAGVTSRGSRARTLWTILALVALGTAPPAAAGPAGVLVSAAASLTDVMNALAAVYTARAGTAISLNLGGSSSLARQIANGAPVDVFVSADEAQMDVVDRAGLVAPGTRVDLLSNQLVIVAPSDEARPLASVRDLTTARFRRIAAANPEAVPAGVYAKRYLEAEGLWSTIERKIVPTLDVRAALAAVDAGNVDAAFVYRTDAAIARHATIVFSVPPAAGPRIVYPAAVMARAPNEEGARAFLAFLQSAEARRVFDRFGFLPAPPRQKGRP